MHSSWLLLVASAAAQQPCTSVSPQEAAQAFVRASVNRGNDKVTGHAYQLAYGPFLAHYLLRPVRILEIGVRDGASLDLWPRPFPRLRGMAGVSFGSDGALGKGWERQGTFKASSRHGTIYFGDQSNRSFLDEIVRDLDGSRFDFIVDDGSHVPAHQIRTLDHLWGRLLADGGIYIIEDIETSYWDHPAGGSIYNHYVIRSGIGTRGSAIEKLKQIPDVINRDFLRDPSYSVLPTPETDHSVASIAFARNCVILIKKGKEWADFERRQSARYRSAGDPLAPKRSRHKYGVDDARTAYKAYRAANSWQVTEAETVR